MELEIGAIFEGKVTGITKFGAFVALPGGRSGLVHISEVAHSYVSDVSEFLSVGQSVQVKVISVDENRRINLSIKQTVPPPERPARGGERRGDRSFQRSRDAGERRSRESAPRRDRMAGPGRDSRPRSAGAAAPRETSSSFDDMLKRFMSESESKNARLNRGERSRRRGYGRGN